MDHIAAVTEGNTFDHLVYVVAESLGVDTDCVLFKDLEEVFFNILEDQVEASLSND